MDVVKNAVFALFNWFSFIYNTKTLKFKAFSRVEIVNMCSEFHNDKSSVFPRRTESVSNSPHL